MIEYYAKRHPVYDWVLMKGINLNIENLFYCFSNKSNSAHHVLLPIIKDILYKNPDLLDQTNSRGERLIHALFKGSKSSPELALYFQLILDVRPSEINAKDRKGNSTISYIFNDHREADFDKYRLIDDFDKYRLIDDFSLLDEKCFTPDLIWDIREDCFQTILEHVRKDKSKFLERASERHRVFLKKIESKISKDLFKKWLTNGDANNCFLDQLAPWDRIFALDLHQKNFSDLNEPFYNSINRLILMERASKKNYKLAIECLQTYPQLNHPYRFDLFRRILSEKDFSTMENIFGSDWFQYRDPDGNTLLHHLFSEKDPLHLPYSLSKISLIIAYMRDREFDPRVKNNAGETVIDLAIKNEWKDFLTLLK